MKKGLFLVTIFLLLISSSSYADDNTGKFSLGYHGIISGDFVQGLSSRVWTSDNFGLEGNFYYSRVDVEVDDEDWDADFYAFTGKLLYAPIVKENSKFYVGLEAGYGRASAEGADEDLDLVAISPLVGAEYSFSGIPELGFDWEVGYRYNIFDVGDVDLSLGGISVALGVHYYF